MKENDMKKNLAEALKSLEEIEKLIAMVGNRTRGSADYVEEIAKRSDFLKEIISDTSETLLELIAKLRTEADEKTMDLSTFRALNDTADSLERVRSEWRLVKVDEEEEN